MRAMHAAAAAPLHPLFAFEASALTPLILFALWGVALALFLAFARLWAMLREKRAVNTFRPTGDTDQLDAFSRAHMNTLENLPIFAVVYVSALAVLPAPNVAWLGWVVLGARTIQSITHIASRSNAAVQLRALMQFVQLACFLWLGVTALHWANTLIVY